MGDAVLNKGIHMEKATLTLRRDQQIDMDAAVIALNLPAEFTREDALEHLEHIRAIIEDHVEPAAELLARLGEYRQLMLRALGATKLWENAQSSKNVDGVTQFNLVSLNAAIASTIKRKDPGFPAVAGHCLNVRVVVTPEQWEAGKFKLREISGRYARDLAGLAQVLEVGDIAIGVDDYDLLPLEPVTPKDGRDQLSIRTWFAGVTGWETEPSLWSPENLEHCFAFQEAVEGYRESRQNSPDLIEANQDVEAIYREAFSNLRVPAPFAEAAQSFRHSGRRPS